MKYPIIRRNRAMVDRTLEALGISLDDPQRLVRAVTTIATGEHITATIEFSISPERLRAFTELACVDPIDADPAYPERNLDP